MGLCSFNGVMRDACSCVGGGGGGVYMAEAKAAAAVWGPRGTARCMELRAARSHKRTQQRQPMPAAQHMRPHTFHTRTHLRVQVVEQRDGVVGANDGRL